MNNVVTIKEYIMGIYDEECFTNEGAFSWEEYNQIMYLLECILEDYKNGLEEN